ncbi:MAG TPA: hypothetical protein PLT47_04570 [Bacteroidales bacterium]|nr:hypothetical protein [Bacteroidales bacterium]
MSFFKKVFSSSDNAANEKTSVSNNVAVGRYTEINKKAAQTEYWKKSQDDFSQKRHLDAFDKLLHYMLNPAVENIKINRRDGALNFEMLQGSKIIFGKADENNFSAEARIACYDRPSVAFLRKLMNMNYVLQYNRFAIKDDIIYLKFDSKTIDASPNKVYYALRELALKCDKIDDNLVGEFEMLHAIDNGHTVDIPENLKEIKYKYLHRWIDEALNKISTLNEDRMSGGISYILLALLFRIDYLLQPQGVFFEDIEKINGIYNAKDNKSTLERNRLMIEELKRVNGKSKEEIFKNLYEVKITFGYVPATSHKQFYEFILEQFKNTNWYYDNRYPDIVTCIYEWIIGYSLFYYGLFPPTYDFLKLAYTVMQPAYFAEMGAPLNLWNQANSTFNKTAIEKEIQKIVRAHQPEYPKLAILMENIRYNNINDFLYTYLNEVTYLNFTK